jgi:hypothetical protein
MVDVLNFTAMVTASVIMVCVAVLTVLVTLTISIKFFWATSLCG